MSRTYRLRRYKSTVAHRFADGSLTLTDNKVDSYWYALIIHGLWGYPCPYSDQPLLVYGGKPWDDVQTHNHYTCMHQLGKMTKYGGSHMEVRKIVASIMPDRLLPIAAVWQHEYIHVGSRRRSRGGSSNLEERAERHQMKIKMRKVFVTGDDSYV